MPPSVPLAPTALDAEVQDLTSRGLAHLRAEFADIQATSSSLMPGDLMARALIVTRLHILRIRPLSAQQRFTSTPISAQGSHT